jgi:ubiquinone/menaquinone biosynthesis C-methylase UbiE
MSAVEKDFDRLALLDDGGWTQNNHYHNFLLRHVPSSCANALEVGCGTGAFSRKLAARSQNVLAIDLSSQMIRVARERSHKFANIDFGVADVTAMDLPEAHFDCVATIATLHHVPLREVLLKLKQALKPAGVLIVLDLFEPDRDLLTTAGLLDTSLNLVAMGVSGALRLAHNGRLKPPREVRAAWEEHGHTDSYPSMADLKNLAAEVLPGANLRKHLLWRYSLIWRRG